MPMAMEEKECWSKIVARRAPTSNSRTNPNKPDRLVASCKSFNGISIAVVDASAIIQGGEQLMKSADKFVSIPEVIDEVRDPVSRHRLSFMPFPVDTIDPSPESLNKVMEFARATGDLQTLSRVDLKLIALTCTLETEIHGTKHLRDAPPPVHTVNVKRLPEKPLPGWGNNVPNLAEWEALEHLAENKSSSTSRILPTRDLSFNSPSNTGNEDRSNEKTETNIEENNDLSSLDGISLLSEKLMEDEHSTSELDVSSENNEDEAVIESISEGFNRMDISGDMSFDAPSVGDDSSEQSWKMRSVSESSVACVTGDFAMQNVILQMGLRLLAPGGMQVRKLHRWILKCHACYTVITEIGRIFCPECGNGGTLRKVAITVGEDGVVISTRPPRVTLRGTKFSLPLPQGGREAVTKNPVLREDQLPRKVLRPRTKKSNKEEDFFATDDIFFCHGNDKRNPLKPPVGKAIALFNGRRNPNDNHFSRRRR